MWSIFDASNCMNYLCGHEMCYLLKNWSMQYVNNVQPANAEFTYAKCSRKLLHAIVTHIYFHSQGEVSRYSISFDFCVSACSADIQAAHKTRLLRLRVVCTWVYRVTVTWMWIVSISRSRNCTSAISSLCAMCMFIVCCNFSNRILQQRMPHVHSMLHSPIFRYKSENRSSKEYQLCSYSLRSNNQE